MAGLSHNAHRELPRDNSVNREIGAKKAVFARFASRLSTQVAGTSGREGAHAIFEVGVFMKGVL
ncbi:MAG: hypothetical protein CSA70_01070 [Rhodobacterales bacterium]|nr:MAG: hypothetical protein CSA70_01070 [Rhodobacterales bacterium]